MKVNPFLVGFFLGTTLIIHENCKFYAKENIGLDSQRLLDLQFNWDEDHAKNLFSFLGGPELEAYKTLYTMRFGDMYLAASALLMFITIFHNSTRGKTLFFLCSLIACLYFACDVMENMSVLQLLETYPNWEGTEAQKALTTGPLATKIKFIVLLCCFFLSTLLAGYYFSSCNQNSYLLLAMGVCFGVSTISGIQNSLLLGENEIKALDFVPYWSEQFAFDYLTNMGASGREICLKIIENPCGDMTFPVALGFGLCFLFYYNLPWYKIFCCIFPLGFAIFDLLENYAILQLLKDYPKWVSKEHMIHIMIGAFATPCKWIFLALSCVIVVYVFLTRPLEKKQKRA